MPGLDPSAGLLRRGVAAVVEASRRHAALVLGLAALAALGAGLYTVRHVSMDTDETKLLSAKLPWRRAEAELNRNFPQNDGLIAVVIDAPTADQAGDAAAALAERMRGQPALFTDVRQPDGLPFFRRNGLLFLPQDQVQGIVDGMISEQPFIGTLAADPNLRGVFSALDLMAQGVLHGAIPTSAVDPALAGVTQAVQAAHEGRHAPLSWQALLNAHQPEPRELRRFVLAKPVLDFKAVEPGHRSVVAVRDAARAGDSVFSGVRVRVTGPIALSDDQFSALAEGAGFTTALSLGLLCLWLVLGLKSVRTVLCVLLTLVAGLIGCAAFAVWAIGPFNPISIAFAPLFIGIAIDFGIQFSVLYAVEAPGAPSPEEAFRRTAYGVGGALAVAASAAAVGFLSFVPTAYSGVSDLGLIAGVGMILALALNLTVLPALLALIGRPSAHRPAESRLGFAADRFLLRRRTAILGVATVLALGAAAALTRLRFDFNPIHLQDQRSESVSTLTDLMGDALTTPYTADVLAAPAEAPGLAQRLAALPEVAQVLDLQTFVPPDQDAKLDVIRDAASLLGPTLNPEGRKAPPTDAEILAQIERCGADLAKVGAKGDATAARLGALLGSAAAAGAPALPLLRANLSDGVEHRLEDMRLALQAGPVTEASLPPEVRRDWVGLDGRWRLELHPKGDSRDNAVLERFCSAVRRVAPEVTGTPVTIQESARTVTGAFVEAGLIAVGAIIVLLFVVLRRPRDIAAVLLPLLLAGLLTLGTGVVLGLPLNFANIITLPLLLGIGVAFDIYFVMRWRSGLDHPLASSTARAVLFSALTTGTAFGSLALSKSPGMADMGKLLSLALFFTLLCTFFVLPALLGPAPSVRETGGSP
jgi:hopanoid biosynthesis associated RND transporter like protein HpnN